jgi:hypothetical protein
MRSLELRQAFGAGAAALALAALAGPCHSQPVPPAGADEVQRRILEGLDATVSDDGPWSEGLIDPLTRLSLLSEEQGDVALTRAATTRALEVVRINRGLYTLDQAPLIQRLIRTEETIGDRAAVWDLDHYLVALARRHPGDVRTIPMLREVADRQMAVLDQYLDGREIPQEVFLGCFYGGNCTGGARRDVVLGMLTAAQSNYSAAIGVLRRNALYSSGELRDLEMKLVRSSDLIRTSELAQPHDQDRYLLLALAHYRGKLSLERLYAYDVVNSSPPLDQVDALIQVADWDLLYSQNYDATEGYERAYRQLREAGATAESIERIFAPSMPVVLPSFEPNPLARDEPRPSTGYIDVAFEITRYGTARHIDIVRSANAKDDEDRLVTLIATSRFRPRVNNGAFANRSPVAVRYYLYE